MDSGGDGETPADAGSAAAPSERGRLSESTRVEAFSDGVLAIAITLLALDLKVPAGRPGGLVAALLGQWPSYLAYLASFLYVGVVWANHHALFGRIALVDRGLLWRNLMLLLPVSLLPFPTATVAAALQHGDVADQRGALVLYGAFASAMGLTWLSMFQYLIRHPRLVDDSVGRSYFAAQRSRALAGILSPALAVLLSLVTPALALGLFVALALFYSATSEGWPPGRRSRS